jgi:cytochrome b
MGGAAASQNAGGSTPPATVKVWDPFVRIFHWSLAALVLIAFVTGDEAVLIHVAAGYAIVGLVAARILWGFIGPRHARFSDFVKSPTETLRYGAQAILARSPRYLGHNPLGGAMIVALLAMLLIICGGGYVRSETREDLMFTRVLIGGGAAALVGVAMLATSTSPSSAFTLSLPSLEQPMASSQVERVWWDRWGRWHSDHRRWGSGQGHDWRPHHGHCWQGKRHVHCY